MSKITRKQFIDAYNRTSEAFAEDTGPLVSALVNECVGEGLDWIKSAPREDVLYRIQRLRDDLDNIYNLLTEWP